jgi:hypothetical protein
MDYEVTVTTLLTDEVRTEYEELLDLLRQDGIEGRIAERREQIGRGVTWIEFTVTWLPSQVSTTVAGWSIEKNLDVVSERAKQWMQNKRRRQVERDPELKARPQSVIIKSVVAGEPVRRIDVDSDGNVTEYGWVEIDNDEHDQDLNPGNTGTGAGA